MNKIGLHVIGGTSLALGKPRVVKLVNPSVAYVRQVRGLVGPACLIVVRWETRDQPLDGPEARAQQWFDAHRADMLAMADNGVAFEGLNEIADSNAANYAVFERKRLTLMHPLGLRAAVGNWSVGVPNLSVWGIYQPVLDEMRPGDLVALHEYWSSRADILNQWHCGRWSLVLQIKNRPIVVTECGRDVVEGKGKPGWQLTCSADEFLEDLRVYDREVLSRWPNVAGATVFQVGSGDTKWKLFDVSSIWPRVVAETVPAPPPVVVPPPPIIPPPVEVPMFPVVGRTFDWAGFQVYLQTVKPFAGIKWVCVHHTAIPTAVTWMQYPQDHWVKQLPAYYYGQGWTACPHLFVSDRGILVVNPLSLPGRGVAEHNQDSLHIEVVGDFTKTPPSGPTLDNAIAASASLLKWSGVGIGGLTNHRTLQTAWTECPGSAWLAVWGAFQSKVNDRLTPPPPVVANLPSSEPSQVPAVIAEKLRWWLEQATREYEAGNAGRFKAILYDLLDQQKGLLYRLEGLL